MSKFIVATKNRGKLDEIRKILEFAGFQYKVISMEEAGIDTDIDETGTTFEENALIKAREIWEITGGTVMADDSGLEVEYLNGAPGIYTSRFAGNNATDEDKNYKLLKLLEEVPLNKRKARFVCAIAVIQPDGNSFNAKGICDGYIALKPEGNNGFGYDPIFYIPEYKMTVAQMLPEQKNIISHRAKALKEMINKLKNICHEK